MSFIKNFENKKKIYFQNEYDLFMSQIKDCPEKTKTDYKWKSNYVCLNIKITYRKDEVNVKLNRTRLNE